MSWKPLPISARAGAQLPSLLISAAFQDDAYTIHLTDLTSIWSESLDRQTIIRRSREENTSIDPSSSGQFKIFLDKIRLGLEGADGSVLTVGDGEEGRPGLVLGVTVKLPGGLVPLQWSYRLFAAPQSLLTSQLVLPLLKAQHMRAKELEGLQEILRQKDHVIEKLVENFKGDLSEVFPHGRTKKKGEWQSDKVKGMPKFEYNDWRTTLENSSNVETATLIEEAFSSAILPSIGPDDAPKNDEDEEEEEGEWWENMPGMSVNLKTGKMTTGAKGKKGKAVVQSSPVKPLPKSPISKPKIDDSTEDEDDFQVQSTPAKAPSIATTEDDNDLDAPSQVKIPDSFPRSPLPVAETSKPKKKLGAIGGKKVVVRPPPADDESTADEDEKEASPPPALEPETKPKKTLGKIGGKKQRPPPSPSPDPEAKPARAGSDIDSNVEPEKSSPATVPTNLTPEPAPPKPKRKLGQLGGKKKTVEATPAAEIKPEPTSSALTPVKKKLGIIGGKRDSSSPGPETERGRAAAVKAERTPTPETPKRETSQERADHKREALKRELEEKAKVPVKKKRKF